MVCVQKCPKMYYSFKEFSLQTTLEPLRIGLPGSSQAGIKWAGYIGLPDINTEGVQSALPARKFIYLFIYLVD